MVIIISYNKQTWNEYNDSQTADENLANGAIISADRLNNMETGISNNDINKVTDNKNGTIEVNGQSITPMDTAITQLDSTDMNTVLTAGFYQSISGTNGIPSGDNYTIYQVIPLSSENGVQIAYKTSSTILGMRSWNYNTGTLTFTSWVQFADDAKVVHSTGTETIAGDKTFADPVDVESSLFVTGAATLSTQPTNGTQVYPVYATSDNDTDAETLISTLQASGFSGLIGIPES